MTTAVRDNLPVDVTSLVGRQGEVSQVKKMLSSSRLATLTGVGGVGKTRLALQVARQLRRAFPDGVWLAPLAEVGETDLLALTVMEAVGLRSPTQEPVAALTDYLRDKQLLLVLDNCEHLVEGCAELVARLLPACPRLRILATSREPMGIDGESVFMVPTLPVPDLTTTATPESMALFAERAAAAVPGFLVTENNRQAVASLCRHLDGLPLAIELAAVRMRVLSVEELLARQGDRYALLTRGNRSAQPRHRSLRAAVDWSFELCSDTERLLWARLSAFAGGCDLEAAQHVCAGEGLPAEEVLEAIAGLLDKSILLREETAGRVRYRMLETIRQYGRERLLESREEEVLHRRHRDYYLEQAEQLQVQWFGPGQTELLVRMRAEHANLRAALEFCLSEPAEMRTGLHMAGALWLYWMLSGLQKEGEYWLRRTLASQPEPSSERAIGLWVYAYLLIVGGEKDAALAMIGECEQIARRLDDAAMHAHAIYLSGFAHLLRVEGLDQSVPLLNEGIRLEQALGEPNPHVIVARVILSLASCMSGQVQAALTIAEECAAELKASGEQYCLSWCLTYLGLAEWRQHDGRQATQYLREAIRCKQPFNDLLGIGCAMEYLAWSTMDLGDPERAARLLGVSSVLWEPLGPLGPLLAGFELLQDWHGAVEEQIKVALGEVAYQQAFHSGAVLPVDKGISYALGEETSGHSESPPAECVAFTQREKQVIQMLAEGLSNRCIAERLVIARRTAECHVANILTKLGFTTRSQVASWAASRPSA
ncbi:LuxR C-terminal-related transcriptional regulator [Kitasatospora sp. NBC_00240]|uniref:ATP-binding protein n=1 Tax=Kitasatospora sp. NBC_00240 TaxID=2903567 RepID=UPI00225428CF|nr:LuxR C-terminal-related transcriptional regulator [Kitasatospora sp. NBC_00240]MCX5215478.1 LuxR C-terminal-related transcriptional regulator [Kitasatospora sp. NBC_00240]